MIKELMMSLVMVAFAMPFGYYLQKADWDKISPNGAILVVLALLLPVVTIFLTEPALFFPYIAALMLGYAISMLRDRFEKERAIRERIKSDDYKLHCLVADYLNGIGPHGSLPVCELDVSDFHPQAVSTVLEWMAMLDYDCSDITSVGKKRQRTLLIVKPREPQSVGE